MTKVNSNKKDNRRGFTIVELVVAMVIIVIVSGAGISLVMTQTKVDSQATQTIDATNICENAIECFRYAVNVSGSDADKIKTEFYNAFVLTGALDTKKYPQKDADENVNIYSEYEINTSGAKITIAIDGNKIDSASSALRNYNSTVTKGNTNRNIQDLENLFVKEGAQPFLNDIDDVNAAMDLLNARSTGDSWLANLTTQLSRPALKGVRYLNQKGIPETMVNFSNKVSPEIRRLLTPALVQLGVGE